MTFIDPNLALQATLPVDVPTLADAIERIVNNTGLERTRRRDMASALRSIAKALGRPPEILPASAHWLQRRLERVHHEQLGVTAKTWRNITSNAISALRHLGFAQQVARGGNEPLSPAWTVLADAIKDDMALHRGLSRFIYPVDSATP